MSLEIPEIEAKDVKYFNSIRNYTLSLLNAFNGVHLYVPKEDSKLDKVFNVPVSFANYEKALILEDISEDTITKGNYNFLPRIILSFETLTKAPDRQTNKFQRLFKSIYLPENPNRMLNVAYNSLAYDFQFTLLIQARGLTQASQLTEQVLSYFKPTMNLNILECPIFDKKTETQIQISDPNFEIQDDFEDAAVNLISVTFDLTLRGNIYSPIELQAPVETLNLFIQVWDEKEYEDSKMADHFKFDYNQMKVTRRVYNGTQKYTNDVLTTKEEDLIKKRSDFDPHEEILDINLP